MPGSDRIATSKEQESDLNAGGNNLRLIRGYTAYVPPFKEMSSFLLL